MGRFDNYLFRCHALGKIMTAGKSLVTEKQLETITSMQGKPKLTEKQTEELNRLIKKRDNPELSQTCKTYLIECYVSEIHNRQKDVYSRAITKGLEVEEDSITLHSRIKQDFNKKNKERLNNNFITGLPDIIEGQDVYHATHVKDIKSSWDLFTFYAAKLAPLNPIYDWQINGYCYLSGAESGTLAYCLINTPETLINKECQKLMWEMGAISDQSPEYVEAREKLEKEMRFDDVPLVDRMFERFIRRDENKIRQIPERVEECREWLNELHYSMTTKTEYVNEPF